MIWSLLPWPWYIDLVGIAFGFLCVAEMINGEGWRRWAATPIGLMMVILMFGGPSLFHL